MRTELLPRQTYMDQLGPSETASMRRSKEWAEKLNKAPISISPSEGRVLCLLVKMIAAKKVVELGTLTGYSAQWILQGMSAGELWTLEKEVDHHRAAEEVLSSIDGAPVKVHALCGDAPDLLKQIEAHGPFDAVFIDANKAAYLSYGEWAYRNLRSGGLIIADNVFLRGSVYQTAGAPGEGTPFSEKQVEVMKQFNAFVSNPENFVSAFVPTDEGLLVAMKK